MEVSQEKLGVEGGIERSILQKEEHVPGSRKRHKVYTRNSKVIVVDRRTRWDRIKGKTVETVSCLDPTLSVPHLLASDLYPKHK